MNKNLLRAIRLLIILVAIYYLIKGEFNPIYSLLSIFISTFASVIIEKIFKFRINRSSQILIIIIVFMSSFLGRASHFYNTYHNFDLGIHFLAGIALANIGTSLYKQKVNKKVLIIIFSISFAVCLSSLWEIYEYFLDTIFNANNQHWQDDYFHLCNHKIGKTIQPEGLIDTMQDMIANLIGCICFQFKYFFKKKR